MSGWSWDEALAFVSLLAVGTFFGSVLFNTSVGLIHIYKTLGN